MTDGNLTVNIMQRMKDVRKKLVKEYPFFGELFMNLNLAVGEVGTACTDGKHIIMDPSFADRLTDEEMQFIYMHEVMHVVYFHCYRRDGRDHFRWNIACDLVVNSNIIMAMGLDDFIVDGDPVMHRVNGYEAYHYTADEVYELLSADDTDFGQGGSDQIDSHEIWEEIDDAARVEQMDRWDKISLDATGNWYGKNVGIAAGSLKRYKNHLYKSQLKWKQIVRDFVRYQYKDQDFGFRPPDRRLEEEEFIYPGLNDVESEVVEDIWIFIDKSGSISLKMMRDIVREIEYGLRQVKNMRGMVSFFDAAVTPPVPFETLNDFMKMKIPLPNGGTSFYNIFQYAVRNRKKYDPKGIMILTDGYAPFPEKNPLPGVDVLWIIVDNPEAKPQFGKKVHINSERK